MVKSLYHLVHLLQGFQFPGDLGSGWSFRLRQIGPRLGLLCLDCVLGGRIGLRHRHVGHLGDEMNVCWLEVKGVEGEVDPGERK